MKAFPLEVIEATMYKKPYIYTYARTGKYSPYVKNVLLFTYGYILVLYNCDS